MPGGRIDFVTRVHGQRGLPNKTPNAAAHGAVHNLVRASALELAAEGIMVNGIALGWMSWMDDRITPGDEDLAVHHGLLRFRAVTEEE